jgi:hypothetical protein
MHLSYVCMPDSGKTVRHPIFSHLRWHLYAQISLLDTQPGHVACIGDFIS